eukprot:1291712-Pleurochrysis_carterae.AAC.2
MKLDAGACGSSSETACAGGAIRKSSVAVIAVPSFMAKLPGGVSMCFFVLFCLRQGRGRSVALLLELHTLVLEHGSDVTHARFHRAT